MEGFHGERFAITSTQKCFQTSASKGRFVTETNTKKEEAVA